MPLVYNGTNITEVIYNGTKLTKIVYNGTAVFGGTGFRLATWETGLPTNPSVSTVVGKSYDNDNLKTPATLNFAIRNYSIVNGTVSIKVETYKVRNYANYGFEYHPIASNDSIHSTVLVSWSSGNLTISAKNYASSSVKTTPTEVVIDVSY